MKPKRPVLGPVPVPAVAAPVGNGAPNPPPVIIGDDPPP